MVYNTEPSWTAFTTYMTIHFTHVITDLIADTEIGLDPSSSVIKRLRCLEKFVLRIDP